MYQFLVVIDPNLATVRRDEPIMVELVGWAGSQSLESDTKGKRTAGSYADPARTSGQGLTGKSLESRSQSQSGPGARLPSRPS